MRNLEEDNQSNKHLVVGSIEVLEDISGNGVKTIKQSIEKIDNNLNAAIAIQNNYWSQLSSDRTISPVEKKTIYKEFQNIQNTHLSIMAAAETLGYLSELQIVEYQEKYTALYNYLITTLKLFDNLEEATNISSRTKFDGYFTAYYDKEFRARTLLSKGQGGGYQDYQFAVGDLDDYPTDDSQWHDGPPEVPAGKYLWCRTRWVDAEGYAGQWYTFRIQGTNGSYHEYQFSQGSKEEHTTVESEWYDAPPSIEEGYYLWCRQRYVDTNGDPEEWSYFRIDGSNGGWQDTEFAAGELDTYPTSESAWTDAPPTIPEHKYLWQRTRWIQDDQKSEWTYTRLSGASAGYQDYQFAIGTLSGFIVPIYINNKELYINNSRLVIQDPLLGDWYDAPPAVPEGMYLWCRTRWIDENGVAGEWRYFRMSGQVGGYQDYMFAAGDLDSYPTSEASWHDAPPTIPEGKYLWQRTRWIEDNKPTEEWTYTRLQGENADDVIVMFSVNGSSNWHLNFQDGDYYMKVSTDGGTTYTAPAKIVGENAPEVKTLYSIDGTSNWHETFTEGDYFMKLSTDDGLTWTDPARIVGENAPEMQTKYSIDGTSNWHFPYAEGDYFMITSTDGGETWSDPMRVVGENAPATLALYGQTRDGSFHSTFTEGDYFMKLSIDGGLTYGDPIQIVGEDGASVYAQYSTDGLDWHDPPFVEGDLYMRTSSDGITWSDAARIVAEATEKYIGAKDAYIEPAAGTYFLAIVNFVNPLEETVIINESELKINSKTLVIQQQFTAGMIYHSGEDLVWRAVLDRNDWRYLVATCDLKKYNLDLAPAVEEIFSDHLQPIEAQIEEHNKEITVINNQLVVIDENIKTKLDAADYHIPINKGSLYADPQDAQEGDFYVYVGPESQTRHKSNVYVFTENEWIEKDPTSNQDGAYYMACLNQILDANVNEEGYFAAVFAASMYANTAWLTQVHSSIIYLSEYGHIQTDDYAAGATFANNGITAKTGGKGFLIQDAVGNIPAYLDMNGYAHFGNDVLIDGKMKATNADIHGTIEASELKLSKTCIVGDNLTLDNTGKITANNAELTDINISRVAILKGLFLTTKNRIHGNLYKFTAWFSDYFKDITLSNQTTNSRINITGIFTLRADGQYIVVDVQKMYIQAAHGYYQTAILTLNGTLVTQQSMNLSLYPEITIKISYLINEDYSTRLIMEKYVIGQYMKLDGTFDTKEVQIASEPILDLDFTFN